MASYTDAMFESLLDLPFAYHATQCVRFKDEILICGGHLQLMCYSYHTIKNDYRLFSIYPKDAIGYGHAVVAVENIMKNNNEEKKKNNNNNNNNNNRKKEEEEEKNYNDIKNELTLLSFGGQYIDQEKYTLALKYQSVWEYNNPTNTSLSSINRWIPTNHHIGTIKDQMFLIRALIGGIDRQLLFIIYAPCQIDVLDLKSLQCITKSILPFSCSVGGSCFVKTDYEMMMIHKENGIVINYDEKKNTFEYQNILISTELAKVSGYGYICIKDFIVLFGGFRTTRGCEFIESLYIYSIKNKTWKESIHQLPIPMKNTFAITNQNGTHIHIIGGLGKEKRNQHLRIKIRDLLGDEHLMNEIRSLSKYWIRNSEIKRLGWIEEFHSIIAQYLWGEKSKPH